MLKTNFDIGKMKGRRSIRFKDFDYSSSNAYFVTLCADKMKTLFGDVIEDKVVLNNVGKIASQYWEEIPKHFEFVTLDEYVVMPNHIHGIIMIIRDEINVKFDLKRSHHVEHIECDNAKVNKFQKTLPGSISTIIRSYKSAVTRWMGKQNIDFKWQRNFFERVIRNENELNRIREYVYYNPLKWYYENEKSEIENLVLK